MKGVLDRFEGNLAVILIEEVQKELILDKEKLPKGSQVNTVFSIEQRDDDFHILGIDEKEEHVAKATTSDLLAKLRAKSNGSRFNKN
ncbi:DUF3006 domain-containing protein [Ornithinibacillus contaminans]|uniref:DUF3006 domain-containing protein n=1 Tax=Ornithinibacillus contaminans TaxID=694055 RepID=UPI00064D9378|nr:DUF3006 domain-containing protein [Ornithinibacillus contaminans]